jgi:hypothetical protein
VTLVLACSSIVPVPPGFNIKLAFELVEISVSLKIKLSMVTEPVIVAPLMVGVVKVFPVNTCDPVSVTTDESILIVSVCPEPAVSMPVPPAMVKVCESNPLRELHLCHLGNLNPVL